MNRIFGLTSPAWTAGAFALALVALNFGCDVDVPQDPDVSAALVLFEPDIPAIPLPSDLALEDDGTMPNAGADLPSSAQRDFYTYVGTLHGWLPDSNTITIPVSTKIDMSSVKKEDVRVFKLGKDGATRLEVGDIRLNETQVPGADDAPATTSYEIAADIATPLQLGTFYGFVFTGNLKTATGAPVVRSQAMHFATQSAALVDDKGAPTVDLLEGKDETARTLEGLRQHLAPVIQAALADDSNLKRKDILSASHWHTALDAFAVFDPTGGNVPIPNEFVRNGPGGKVTLPLPAGADPLTTAVINELNSRTGFAITADGWLPFSGAPLKEDTISQETILVARTEEGALAPALYTDRYSLTYHRDWNVVTFGPEGYPFDQNEASFGGDDQVTAGIITTGVKSINPMDPEGEGWEVKPSPAFIFLRSQYKIFDAATGKSLVTQLDDATASALEDARISYQKLFLAAMTLGHGDRKTIANAWAFQTEEATAYQQRLNARAVALTNAGDAPTAQGDPATATKPAGTTNLGLQQSQAVFTTKFFLDPANDLALTDTPIDQPVPLTVSVPDTEGGCGEGPFPVVIVGHGLGGKRENAVAIFAETFAAEPYCMATVALDFPFHGQRAVEGVPFISANVILSKNNFLQAVVDLTVLTEVIKAGGLEGVLDADEATTFLDTTKIGYAGQSLGAILGVNFVATNDDVTVAALNVPGGKLTDVVLGGALGADILGQLPSTLVPGSFDFFRTFNFLQWIMEPADPWSFAPHVQNNDPDAKSADRPLFNITYDADEDKFVVGQQMQSNQVMVQMAGKDATIPNSTTQLLAETIGVSLKDTTFPDAAHGFISGDDDAAKCARQQAAVWLQSGLAGSAALGAGQKNACGLTAP